MLDGISFHFGFCAAKSWYSFRKISGCNAVCMRSRISRRLGQMSFRQNRLAVLVFAKRLVRQVNVHPARERKRDDERR